MRENPTQLGGLAVHFRRTLQASALFVLVVLLLVTSFPSTAQARHCHKHHSRHWCAAHHGATTPPPSPALLLEASPDPVDIGMGQADVILKNTSTSSSVEVGGVEGFDSSGSSVGAVKRSSITIGSGESQTLSVVCPDTWSSSATTLKVEDGQGATLGEVGVAHGFPAFRSSGATV
jgi:hypothetical protein